LTRLLAGLIGAAALEVGGNAFLREGLQRRWWLLLVGGIITLALYGLLVNLSGLDFDFGRLMGAYIVVFFLVSQLLAFLMFRDAPSTRILLGGAFILVGGLTILV
jgi:drug/metabolite transporter superfamily protein YnfA